MDLLGFTRRMHKCKQISAQEKEFQENANDKGYKREYSSINILAC